MATDAFDVFATQRDPFAFVDETPNPTKLFARKVRLSALSLSLSLSRCGRMRASRDAPPLLAVLAVHPEEDRDGDDLVVLLLQLLLIGPIHTICRCCA